MFLIVLFTTWMLSPFVGLLLANKISKRWTVLTRVTLYWLMIVLTIGSLISYSGAFSPLVTKPAFKFLVIPFISWLLIVTVIPIVSRLSNKTKDI
jgi:biotin transporter BioY